MPLDEGTGTRPRKGRKRPPPNAQAKGFGADVGLFTPPALVPPPRAPVRGERDKVPVPFPIAATPQQARKEREAKQTAEQHQRVADALIAPVSTPARIRVRRGETAAERKVRTNVQPPKPTKAQRLEAAPDAGPGVLDILGAVHTGLGRALAPTATLPVIRGGRIVGSQSTWEGGETALNQLATQGVAPLEAVIGPVVDTINDGLGFAVGILTPPRIRPGGRVLPPEPKQAGLIPDHVARNLATGLAQVIAGAPAGAVALLNDPGKVWEETKRQYASYYGPLLQGDFAVFQKNMEEQPVQILFDVWAALSLGLGATARAATLGQTVRATPEQLAGLRRGEAIIRSILFRQHPYAVRTNEGAMQVFGRRPTYRAEEFRNAAGETATVQRMVPQSALGTKLADIRASIRAAGGGKGSRGEKLVREEFEQRGARSRAELATFARRINGYNVTMLDSAARILGLAGGGRKKRTAKLVEGSRVDAARALAMALDRAGIHGGDYPSVLEKIAIEIEQRQNRYIEEGGGGELQARRIRDLALAGRLLQHYIENPDSPDAVTFANDLQATRELAEKTERRLIDAGLLSPNTAQNMIDRQTRDVERIEQVQGSVARAQLEDSLFRLWDDEPESVATALHLLDAQALSFERRTGLDPSDFYDDLIAKVTVGGVPEGALQQIRNFNYAIPPEVAAKNLAAKLKGTPAKPSNKSLRRGGIVVGGKITPKEWVKRVEKAYPDVVEADTMARWYKLFEPLFRETFGRDADMVMRGFAVSQANASPTFGIAATLKVMDKVRRGEPVGPREIAVVAQGIETAVKAQPILKGMAAKLRDFSDSLDGKTTRTHMGDDPRGGPPVAVDIHALRDLGWIDRKMALKLEEVYGLKPGVHYTVDNGEGTASGTKYERAAEMYVEITDHLNEISFHGRNDWIPSETQALGWGAIQKTLGVDPEDLGYALGRNTRSIDFEIFGGPEGLGEGLTLEQIVAVQREFESAARDLAASVPGIWVRGIEHRMGGWGGQAAPYLSVKVVGSREAVAAARTKIAQGFRQGLVQASRENTGPDSRAAVVIDSPAFADAGVMAAFFKRLYEVEPRLEGFMQDTVEGNVAMVARTSTSNVSPKTVDVFLNRYRAAVEQVESEMGIDVSLGAKNIELLIGDQYGDAPRTATEGRDRWAAGGVDDPLARAVGERLREALERAGAGADAPRFTPRVLTREEAWEAPPRPGYVYHGTTEAALRSIMESRTVEVGTRSEPPGAWFAENPALAAFHGDTVLELPDEVLPEGTQRLPLGAVVSQRPVMFQWDYPRFYDTEPRGARGGALVRRDGTEIILGAAADLTTVVHEAAHAFLPEQLGWLSDFDPEWAEGVAARLEMEDAASDVTVIRNDLSEADAWVYLPETKEIITGRDHPSLVVDQLAKRAGYSADRVSEIMDGYFDGDDKATAAYREMYAATQKWASDRALFGWTNTRPGAGRRHLGFEPKLWSETQGNSAAALSSHGEEALRAARVASGGNDPTLTERAQEIYAYSVEAWAALGRPTATQLRERFAHFRAKSREVYGGRVRIPEEYRKAVNDALNDQGYVAWLTEMFDPLYGMRAQDGAFFISRRTPLSRNPMEKLRQKSGLGKPSDRVHARSGVLEEQARDVVGPLPVLENAERWQRHFEQQAKLDEIRQSDHAVPVPVVNGFYDFSSPPPGHVPFNPDGLRGWTRHENEALGRTFEDIEASMSLEDADFPQLPLELAERIHTAGLDIANRVFPTSGFPSDPSEGRLYYLPSWYKDALTRDMSGALLNRAVMGKGLSTVSDVLKTLNALQRLRMYLALRYVVLNVGATVTLTTLHQGLFMPFNFGRAVRTAHAHPDLAAMNEAEVGSGFYEALSAGELQSGAPGVAQLIERSATAVGHFVSRPEAFLRSTSMIHHMYRAGFRTYEQQMALHRAAREGPGEAREILNQLGRWAEEDVVRFRGLPAAERDMLRAIFFVSGWLIAASRFALRYPMNHPFWTTAMAQLGDDGWNLMREEMAEWVTQTRYSLEVKEGKTKEGVEFSAQTDIGQWLPFGTATDVGSALLSFGSPEAERRILENLAAGGKLIYGLMSGDSVYGTPYTMATAADDFLISGTPLDYIADAFPGAFRAFNHQRTPSKLRVDQTMEEYGLEFIFGRAYPNKYVKAEIEKRWAQAMKDTGALAARRVRDWADKVEAYHGSPPDEASVAAKVAMYDWQSQWSRAQDDIQGEEDKLVTEAQIKAKIMQKYGWIAPDFVYRATSAADLHALVETDWENTVALANDDANDQWSIPRAP